MVNVFLHYLFIWVISTLYKLLADENVAVGEKQIIKSSDSTDVSLAALSSLTAALSLTLLFYSTFFFSVQINKLQNTTSLNQLINHV